jgi:hypothetical protein
MGIPFKSGTEEYRKYWRDYYQKNKLHRLQKEMEKRRRLGIKARPKPPFNCKFCGIELTEKNWYDSRRNTSEHGRYMVCNKCQGEINKKSRYKVRHELTEEWDNKCCICNEEFNNHMIFHEIDWINHNHNLKVSYYRENFDRFIYICQICHQGIHFIHNWTGLELEDILAMMGWEFQ